MTIRTKGEKRAAQRANKKKNNGPLLALVADEPITRPSARKVKPIEPITEAQNDYMMAISSKDLIFGVGPAGTGKTFIAASMAADMLKEALDAKDKDFKLIVTRPVVEAEESLGFLPGEMDEKFDPYFKPVKHILEKRLGASFVEYLIKTERIVAQPLAYLRGHTFENCVVLLDEAQNTTEGQMKLFLTRIGENCKVVVDGDIRQKDIKVRSGLEDTINRFHDLEEVEVVEFSEDDIVRSGLVRKIVKRYES